MHAPDGLRGQPLSAPGRAHGRREFPGAVARQLLFLGFDHDADQGLGSRGPQHDPAAFSQPAPLMSAFGNVRTFFGGG